MVERSEDLKKLVNYQQVDSADVDLPILILERGCRIYYHLSSIEPGQLKKVEIRSWKFFMQEDKCSGFLVMNARGGEEGQLF